MLGVITSLRYEIQQSFRLILPINNSFEEKDQVISHDEVAEGAEESAEASTQDELVQTLNAAKVPRERHDGHPVDSEGEGTVVLLPGEKYGVIVTVFYWHAVE